MNEEYRPFTTFYDDFSIADRFGKAAIKDTLKRAWDAWKDDYKYLTELVMTLNWKSFEWYGKGREDLCELYSELWLEKDAWMLDNLEGEAKEYYITITD